MKGNDIGFPQLPLASDELDIHASSQHRIRQGIERDHAGTKCPAEPGYPLTDPPEPDKADGARTQQVGRRSFPAASLHEIGLGSKIATQGEEHRQSQFSHCRCWHMGSVQHRDSPFPCRIEINGIYADAAPGNAAQGRQLRQCRGVVRFDARKNRRRVSPLAQDFGRRDALPRR